MKTSRSSLIYTLILMLGLPLGAQEHLLPLPDNPHARILQERTHSLKSTRQADTIGLPILEDFASYHKGLDRMLWTGDEAFANNNFSLDPPTIGAVTLDALDASGSIYPHARISPLSFGADTLETVPIDLAYPASDSIYLSFFYQPGGLCDIPEAEDSLILEFYAPDPVHADSGTWSKIWHMEGSESHEFRQAMVPVTDPGHLQKAFRFRFRNVASLSKSNDFPDKRGNADYWHLDYIRLDRQRSHSDTILKDVAFTTGLSPLFNTLSMLPWAHFETAYNSETRPYLEARYRNHDAISHNVTRSLSVEEPLYGEFYQPGAPTAQDLPAFTDTSVQFIYVFPIDFSRGDSALFRFKAALRTDENDPRINDTIMHDLCLKNVYAYDDGTAEAAYGLLGDGTTGGMVALKYKSFEPDHLTGVYISFNQLYDSVNLDYGFSLVVWDDDNGKPGTILHEEGELSYPEYSPEYPGFVRYDLSSKVPVDGTFYIGWRQVDDYKLNVGFDLNSNPGPVLFYNIGSWTQSGAAGALMMRPVTALLNTSAKSAPQKPQPLRIWPNPASEQLFFELEQGQGQLLHVRIFDMQGRCVRESRPSGEVVDISQLSPGFYVFHLLTDRELRQAKFLVR